MSFWSALARIAGVAAAPFTGGASLIPTVIGAAGSALGSAADASAQNRGAQIDAATVAEQINQARQAQYFDQSLAREDDRRASGNDAFRNAQRAAYLESATDYKPAAGLTSYGFGPRAATDAEKAAAQSFAAESQRRLAAGDSLLPQVQDPGQFAYDPKLMKPSGFERFSSVASPVLTGAAGLMNRLSDPLAALRAELPDLDEAQLRVVAEALRQKDIKF